MYSKHRLIRRSLIGALLTTTLTVPATFAGVEIQVKTVDHSEQEPSTETSVMSVDTDLLKMDIQQPGTAGKNTMIFRGKWQDALVLDHQNKTYTVIDKGTIDELGGQLNAAMRELDKQLAGLPKEQQDMMRKMLQGQLEKGGVAPQAANPSATDKSVVEQTQETAEKNGFKTTKYLVKRDNQLIREVWVASWDQLPDGNDVRNIFESMEEFFNHLIDAFASVSSQTLGQQAFDMQGSPFQDLRQMNGFPVLTMNYDGGRLTSQTSVEAVERRSFDTEDFKPPATYKKGAMGL